nr:udp-glycosyltransferase 74e2 [Quercus suber]
MSTLQSQKYFSNICSNLPPSPPPIPSPESIEYDRKVDLDLYMETLKVPKPEGEEELPSAFLEETKDRGHIVTWCPQTKVLAHPSIACFLTHCGWSSLLESIAIGVPMIAYPQWTDQPTNAKLIAEVVNMGVRLKPGSDGFVATMDVERCIEQIMTGPRSKEFKKNVAEFERAARVAVADGGSSDRNIQDFVNEIIGHSRRSL